MLTLQSSEKPKFNPWKPLVWAVENPYPAWLLFCTVGSIPTFLLSLLPIGWLAITFTIICIHQWAAGVIMLVIGALVWLVEEGGFGDIADWIRDRAENYGKVEDKEAKKRAFRGKEYTY